MNNRQMFSIKEAALEMGLDKKTLREKIKNGEIKVEKRIEGTKEKFFVTRKEVEKFLADNVGKMTANEKLQTIFDNSESMYFGVENLEPIKIEPKRKRTPKAPIEAETQTFKELKVEAKSFDASELLDFEPPIAPASVPDAPPAFIWDLGPDNVYDFEPTRTLDEGNVDLFAPRPYQAPNPVSNFRAEATQESTAEIESVLRTISQEYKRRLEEQREINQFLQLELAHAKRQLLLLPDLQRQADALYLKEFELAALRKQVIYLKEAYLQATQNVTIQAEYTYVYEDETGEVNDEEDLYDQDDEKISLLDDSVLPEMDRQIQKIKRVQEAEQSLILDRLKLDANKRQDHNQSIASMKSKIDQLEDVIATMAEQVKVEKQEQIQEQIKIQEKTQELEQAPVKKPWWKMLLGL